jgi:ribonuclease D
MTDWIRTPDELQALARTLAGTRQLALDSESDSLHHHFEKVCLLQLADDRGRAWLVDTLAVRDLAPLAPVLADPKITKVLHGADYDVSTLKRDFGFEFVNLFDTMIAARFLGRREFGLAALARTELGVELSKGAQKDDWSVRPLSPRQESYALADVQHLLELAGRLGQALLAAGRLEWVREECDAVAALEPARRKKDPDAFLKTKGAERFEPRQLAALRELHAWREGRAEALDVPAFKIADNELLLGLATRPPADADAARSALARFPRVRNEGAAVLAALARAAAVPEAELPRPFRGPPRPPARPAAAQKRIEALKVWRHAEAERSGLEASLILPQRLVDKLVDAAPATVDDLRAIDGLRAWRVAAYGRALLGAGAS